MWLRVCVSAFVRFRVKAGTSQVSVVCVCVRAIVCTHKRAEKEIEKREREGKNVKKSDCGKGVCMCSFGCG